MFNKIRSIVFFIFLSFGIILTSINLYGLTQEIRPKGLVEENLRFANDEPIIYEQAIKEVEKLPEENNEEYASRLTKVVSKSIAHIHWNEEQNPHRFNQQIPIWENYFIFLMSKVTSIPEYQKYHFADYRRSLKRGIGVCGDASMVMSQLLNKNGIPNQILSYPGHVVVAAKMDDQRELLFDPDFGVAVPYTVKQVSASPDLIKPLYIAAGHTVGDANTISRSLGGDIERWNGVTHFITNKYYFEKVAYWLKWPFPIFLFCIAIFIRLKTKKEEK
ncbi:hypothetical protein KO519_05625 [Paraglaciecola agarilytica]|uniref:transglutaminase-like domain-containing protein n=1 Tax=Paraglaciecola chathamensis TaxID=368405 RepID=UPI001C0835C9|nr:MULTISPECIES: transglutaminase-like domain-containing protein [Paraglaciecola]MBU3017177.1 hypothetical protein [Paraglaciecola agarilytica]MDO6558279.1 transglutaminase-like domain-containing protein [Paraglaciecola chathamensis]MDO6838888.1 transglutaminase-like domain-containing protein [Paraglaciecola chathamensis]